MSLTVTVHDDQAGTDETKHVADDDYLLICVGKCYEDGVQIYPKSGTHVITIKGCHPKRPVEA